MLNFALCDDSKDSIIKTEKMLNSIFIENNLEGELVFSSTQPSKLLRIYKR